MTHSEALLKLLAVEPERYDRLRRAAGWPAAEFAATVDDLERAGRIQSRASIGGCGREMRIYFLKDPNGSTAVASAGVVRATRRNTRVEGPSLALREHPRAGAPVRVREAAGPAGGANRATPAGGRGAAGGVTR